MSKKTQAIICTVASAVLLLPGLFLAYAVLFGHTYTDAQAVAAGGLGAIGFFIGMAAMFNWSEV